MDWLDDDFFVQEPKIRNLSSVLVKLVCTDVTRSSVNAQQCSAYMTKLAVP
jgi:hypothetical protein